MKTAKTLLALAIAMVLLMPSCKEDKFTKNSLNTYISLFKTAEDLIGKDMGKAVNSLKNEGWAYNETTKVFTSNDQYVTYTMELTSSSQNKVHSVRFTFNSQSGMPSPIKESYYTEFVTAQITESYTLNGSECKFLMATYGTVAGENFKATSEYGVLEENIIEFVNSEDASAQWVSKEGAAIVVGSALKGAKFDFRCYLTDKDSSK